MNKVNIKDIINAITIFITNSNRMYCICYKNGTNKKILINLGLFQTEKACLDCIASTNIDNLEVCVIKKNYYDIDMKETLQEIQKMFYPIQQEQQYCKTLEIVIQQQILEEINTMLNYHFDTEEILLNLQTRYCHYLYEKELFDLLPPEFKLTLRNDSSKICKDFIRKINE